MILSKTVVTASVSETEALGAELGTLLLERGEGFVAMYGDLGAGKTAFVRGLSSIIAPEAHVCSPTYNIVNEYHGKNALLCHFDMYRIESDDDLYSVGFYDYDNCIIVAEWCEKTPFALPEQYIRVEITKLSENERSITLTEVKQ
jgi:tRNA threonylcarbamoyladenosine biosynthesis protein TsaE